MKGKVSFEVVPINKFNSRLFDEATVLNENEYFKSVKSANDWLKSNLSILFEKLKYIYKEKISFYSGFEVRVLKCNKLKKRYELKWEEELNQH